MTRHTPQWLQAGDYPAGVDRLVVGALWPTPASSGCAVTPASAMTVDIAAGQVAVPSSNNTGSVLCTSDAIEQVTLDPAPASGLTRIDLVICQARGTDLDGGGLNDFVFLAVKGTPGGGVPPTPQNAVALAEVVVVGGSARGDQSANITDYRPRGLAVPARRPPPAPTTFYKPPILTHTRRRTGMSAGISLRCNAPLRGWVTSRGIGGALRGGCLSRVGIGWAGAESQSERYVDPRGTVYDHINSAGHVGGSVAMSNVPTATTAVVITCALSRAGSVYGEWRRGL